MSQKISAVIITYNEEKNIRRCLASLQGIAEEIVVVDSHSTDRTKEICSRYENVNFISTDWKGFSDTKNYGNDIAK
ncbi:glycosyltransferase, partial [bacterium]|nr:glycosyltransferase [bacterium]